MDLGAYEVFEAVSEFPDPVWPDKRMDELVSIRDIFSTPEHIDDGFDSAPSKRIVHLFPDYKKTVAGPEISARIGMATLRGKCPHFDGWVARIENVATSIQ